ncbi:hypothetical protein [Capnocytophaga cynodegmi]|uniref:hypothetical protein n=1 Tax=Capnocytophaga cynodegmi TaxID=28189 RepID=UPI00385A3CA1
MGYHIINITEEGIKSQYVVTEKDLMNINTITEDTIIYQGEEHWTPIQVGKSEFKNYCKDYFRAGLKAQEYFKIQAKENGFILEELYQDKNSFQQYLLKNGYSSIKRGDFLVRNFGNIEIDVKCRSFHNINKQLIFRFRCKDVDKHLNMQKLTNSPIIIAVYQREGDNLKKEIPYFISIDEINKQKSQFKTHYEEKDNTGFCYEIPLSFTIQSFDYIRDFQKKPCFQKIREKYPNAYQPWTQEDDDKLELLYCERKTIKELCIIFGRNDGAIRSRIEKLELKLKYDF